MARFCPRFVGGLCAAAVWALSLAPCAASSAVTPLPGADDHWEYLESPNFELYSQRSPEDARELLHELELFRAVVLERFALPERRRQPVTVFAFASSKLFQSYARVLRGGVQHIGGYYLDGFDRARIVLGPAVNDTMTKSAIFHEYVHHVVRAGDEPLPVWLDEGLAELFATLVVNGRNVELGRPAAGRVLELRGSKLLPLEQLFALDRASPLYADPEHAALFYAQSWALLHFWYFGEPKTPPEALDAFLQEARRRPALPPAALRQQFNQAFGIDYPEMEQRLQHYVTSGRYRWSVQAVPKISPAASYRVSKLTAEEIQPALAALAFWLSRSPAARAVLMEAAARSEPDARALEILGAEHLRNGDSASARLCWEKAIAAGSTNPAVYRELGLMEGRAWCERFDCDLRQPEAATERLRFVLTRSIEYCPSQIVGYEMLAWVEAYAAHPSGGNINLVQARLDGLREQNRTLLALALIRHRLGDNATALRMLERIDRSEPDRWVADAAAVLRARITTEPTAQSAR